MNAQPHSVNFAAWHLGHLLDEVSLDDRHRALAVAVATFLKEGGQGLSVSQTMLLDDPSDGYQTWLAAVTHRVRMTTGREDAVVAEMIDHESAVEAFSNSVTVSEYVDAVLLDHGYDSDGTYYEDGQPQREDNFPPVSEDLSNDDAWELGAFTQHEA